MTVRRNVSMTRLVPVISISHPVFGWASIHCGCVVVVKLHMFPLVFTNEYGICELYCTFCIEIGPWKKKKKNVIGESLSLTQHIVKIHSWWNPRRCTMGAGSKEYGLTTWWGPALICLRCFRKPEDRVRGRRTSPAAYLSQPAFATSSTTLPVARFTWINAVICFSKDTNKFFLYVSECKFYI